MAYKGYDCTEDRVEDRRGFSDCRFLIAAPHDLATPFLLPGTVDVFVKPLGVVAANTPILKIGQVPTTLNLPPLAANAMHFIGNKSKSTRFEIDAGVAIAFEVYVAMSIGPQRKIAFFTP